MTTETYAGFRMLAAGEPIPTAAVSLMLLLPLPAGMIPDGWDCSVACTPAGVMVQVIRGSIWDAPKVSRIFARWEDITADTSRDDNLIRDVVTRAVERLIVPTISAKERYEASLKQLNLSALSSMPSYKEPDR